ncbi:hypothetical protein CARUB_v10015125mg, partial [Capsella rubella]
GTPLLTMHAFVIHMEIESKIVAAKVNGYLVSPTHVLENVDVVETPLSTKQCLKHAKTRSARQKIMRVYYCHVFPLDSDAEDSRKSLQWREKILVNVKLDITTPTSQNGSTWSQRNSSLDESKFLLPGDGIAKSFPANIPAYRKV